MISHRQIILNLATAIANDAEVLAKSKEAFGSGLKVIVGAYGDQVPGTADAPFLWVLPEAVENGEVDEDQSFAVELDIGAVVKGPDGEKYLKFEVMKRGENSNGLIVNGGAKLVEDFRDFLARKVIEEYRPGAILSRIRRVEEDLEHFPLSVAAMYLEFNEPETL